MFARIRIGCDDSHVNVFNTHLQACYKEPGPEEDPGLPIQGDQVNELAMFINNCKNDIAGEPILLTGDFNIDSNEFDYGEGWPCKGSYAKMKGARSGFFIKKEYVSRPCKLVSPNIWSRPPS